MKQVTSSGVATFLAHAAAFVIGMTTAGALVSAGSTPLFFAGLGILFCLAVYYVPKGAHRAIEFMSTLDNLVIVLALGLAVSLGSGCGYSRVEPGHVGIKVHLYGGSKGVDFEPVGVGAFWYNPWYTSLYTYPTYVQTAKWTKDPTEGSPANEELTFNTQEGMIVAADISLSYHLDGAKVPEFFSKFRTDKLDTFTHGFMRNCARDAFNDLGPHYTVEQVYGEKKEELRRAVMDRLQGEVAAFGVVVEQFGYLGALRLPDAVVASLNAKIQATQNALRVQNEVAQAQAEALKTVATAKGAADARLLQANAEAQANKTIAASLTPELVQYLAVQRWDGKRPTVEGTGASLFLGLPAAK